MQCRIASTADIYLYSPEDNYVYKHKLAEYSEVLNAQFMKLSQINTIYILFVFYSCNNLFNCLITYLPILNYLHR